MHSSNYSDGNFQPPPPYFGFFLTSFLFVYFSLITFHAIFSIEKHYCSCYGVFGQVTRTLLFEGSSCRRVASIHPYKSEWIFDTKVSNFIDDLWFAFPSSFFLTPVLLWLYHILIPSGNNLSLVYFILLRHKKQKEEDIAICECKYNASDPDSPCGDSCLNVLTSTECTPGYCPCGDFCKNQVNSCFFLYAMIH